MNKDDIDPEDEEVIKLSDTKLTAEELNFAAAEMKGWDGPNKGPRGGTYWVNTESGEKVYQDPTGDDDTSGSSSSVGDDSDFADKQMNIARESLEEGNEAEAKQRAAMAAATALDGPAYDHMENAVSNAFKPGGMGSDNFDEDALLSGEGLEDSSYVGEEELQEFQEAYETALEEAGFGDTTKDRLDEIRENYDK